MATTSWDPQLQFPPRGPAQTRRSALFLAWLPAILFALILVAESSRAFGSDHTSAPLHSLLHPIVGRAVDPQWSSLHHLIRKAGHFLGYGLFSLLCLRAFRRTLRRSLRKLNPSALAHTFALATAFLAASADEIHQSFLPNRTGCVSDVLLDTFGAITLQLAAILIAQTLRRNQTQTHSVPDKQSTQEELIFAA